MEIKVDRSQKEKAVEDFKNIFNEAEAVIVTHYEGINADSINEFRLKTRSSEVTFKVTKNRLIKIALEGTPYKNISELFSGPTAITFSKDVVAAAKVTTNFAKENDNFIISEFPFSVGIENKSYSYIYYIIFALLAGASLFYFGNKIRNKTIDV